MGQTPGEIEERIKQRRDRIDHAIDLLVERWRNSGAALLGLTAVGLALANGAPIGSSHTRDAARAQRQRQRGLASGSPLV